MNEKPNQVKLADNAFKQGADTRRLKAQLSAGNPYALGKLERLGLEYRGGAIIARTEAVPPRSNEPCGWFALCMNPATGTTPHPVLGDVPTCDRCAGFASDNG